MNSILHPLSHEELTKLDSFLQKHSEHNEHEHNHYIEPGVLNVSELDGLLCALVSAPTLLNPADWIPSVWGEEEPEWRNEAEFVAIVHLMQRHMNTVAATLLEAPEEFEPLFLYEEEEGITFTIVDDWCEGYIRGVKLAEPSWNAGKAEINKLLSPIRAFSSETDWRGHELPEEESDKLSDTIAPNVRAIYQFWRQA